MVLTEQQNSVSHYYNSAVRGLILYFLHSIARDRFNSSERRLGAASTSMIRVFNMLPLRYCLSPKGSGDGHPRHLRIEHVRIRSTFRLFFDVYLGSSVAVLPESCMITAKSIGIEQQLAVLNLMLWRHYNYQYQTELVKLIALPRACTIPTLYITPM